MFLHLGRPIQDLQFWTSFEVGQIYVPNAFVQISSIMPQKRNPVPIEHLRHLACQTFGRARAMLDVMHNTPFTDMNDSEGETQAMGYEAFASARRVLDLLAALVAAIRIDADARRRQYPPLLHHHHRTGRLASCGIEGLSFREAHEIAAAVAGPSSRRMATLPSDGYAPFLDGLRARDRPRAVHRSRAEFAEIVSPEHFVAVRDALRRAGAGSRCARRLPAIATRLDGFERGSRAMPRAKPRRARELDTRFNGAG